MSFASRLSSRGKTRKHMGLLLNGAGQLVTEVKIVNSMRYRISSSLWSLLVLAFSYSRSLRKTRIGFPLL